MRIINLQAKNVSEAARLLAKAYSYKYEDVRKDFSSKKRGERWITAIEDKKVVGVLGYLFDYSHYANYVEDLAVAKEHRGKGIATALLKKFIEISRKNQPKKQPYCLSSTTVNNKASIKLHLGVGFKKMGTIKKLHYGKNEIIFGYKL